MATSMRRVYSGWRWGFSDENKGHCATLLSGTGALIYVMTTKTAKASLVSLTHDYQQELMDRALDNVAANFSSSAACLQSLAAHLETVASLPNMTQEYRDELAFQASRFSFLSCNFNKAGVILENGKFLFMELITDATKPLVEPTLQLDYNRNTYPLGQKVPQYRAVLNASNGLPISGSVDLLPDDYRTRSWYEQALTFGTATEIRVNDVSGQPEFLMAKRVHYLDPSEGSAQGVVRVTFLLANMDQLVATFDLKGGTMYFTNGSHLIGSSVNGYTKGGGNRELLRPSDSNSSLVRQASTIKASKGTPVEVRIDGVNYFVGETEKDIGNIVIQETFLLPSKSVLGHFEAQAIRSRDISIGIACGIVLLGCLVVFTITDPITKEMRHKAELLENLEAKQRAETRDVFKTKFLASMSHDLRNPSAAMIGLLDVLLETPHTEEQGRHLSQVKECAQHQLSLLNEVLDVSKIEAGKMLLDNAPFDLVHLLESLIDVNGVQAAKKGLELCLDIRGGIPQKLLGDATRSRQIFANLLSNSMKFTKAGYIAVRCSPANADVSQVEPGKIRLAFEVEDTGCGIPPEKRTLVFADYSQADGAATAQSYGGTGLGLGIVKKLVQLMGGEVSILDKDTPGCIFGFDLVFQTVEGAGMSRPGRRGTASGGVPESSFQGSAKSSGDPSRLPLAGFNLVFGHANFLARSITAGALREGGATVVEAVSWDEALLALTVSTGLNSRRSTRPSQAPLPRVSSPEEYLDPSNAQSEISAWTRIDEEADEIAEATGGNVRRSSSLRSRAPSRRPSSARTESNASARASDGGADAFFMECAVLDVALLPGFPDVSRLEAELQKLTKALEKGREVRRSGVVVVWIVSGSTPADVRKALRRHGFGHEVSKPLYPSKMEHLLLSLAKSPRASGETPEDPHVVLEVDGSDASSSDVVPEIDGSDASSSDVLLPGSTMPLPGLSKSGSVSGSRGHSKKAAPGGVALKLPLSGLSVLVAEDNPVLRQLAVRSLESLGADVETACNGQEAVDALHVAEASANRPFDLVLMDCQMPVMDGYTASRQIRSEELESPQKRRVAIIALTADGSKDAERLCLDAGMDGVLTKPVKVDSLAELVNKLVVKGNGEVAAVQRV
ncbi:Signal transduction histidine kinase [Klebsormidium nitens]|uniref:Signal transduction histidine kinase n=1 Tax=Klebsormidium nitens TaxID=105231 RepID=A0A1Y1IRL5_KLENI|nr:Signal transduction histidine kinase [Klebsormidium nitens]|eukprot:GAQ92149.1 Signal transduction histidine kinase [Klebsormidium nitens]